MPRLRPRAPVVHPASTLVLLAALVAAAVWRAPLRADEAALSVRITSPLGRSGLPGPIRIVAQVRSGPDAGPAAVQFYVDQHLLDVVQEGPPYAVEWVDENPFERREISVKVVDGLGHEADDRVVLEPFEVTEATQVSSVLLEASVQDKTGRFVKDLPASAFRVFEDGTPQTLDVVRQETVGATFALLVDRSTSMSRRMDFVKETAAELVGYMRPQDRMIVVPFSKTLGSATGPTADRKTVLEAIDAITPVRGTAILDSLATVSGVLAGAPGRRAIVLITDGYDEHSTASLADTLTALKSAQATVYVVGVGGVAGISIKGKRALEQIATDTGGRFFFPSRDRELASVHERLTEDVQNRYLLTYTPTDQTLDGSWRAIAVRTSHPDWTIHTRLGYYAPKPPPIRPMIEFTASDPSGRYLNLTADTLRIEEEGVPQEIETFQEAVEPVSIVLALDASGSMRKAAVDVVESARAFVAALRPKDRLALVMFADRSLFAHDLSTDREFSDHAIEQYHASGGTALYDALSDAMIHLKTVGGRRVVVVMTDGRDENNPGTGPGSTRTFDDVLKYVKESGAMVFGIGLGTKVDRAPLEQLADLSGGRAFFPADVSGLHAEFQRVVEDLRRRYVVGYTSTHIVHDGKWRKVTIQVANAADAVVRSPGGYFAPDR